MKKLFISLLVTAYYLLVALPSPALAADQQIVEGSFIEAALGGVGGVMGGCLVPENPTSYLQQGEFVGEVNLERTTWNTDVDCKNLKFGQNGSGLLGNTAMLIGNIVANPPAHTSEYIADIGENFGIARPVYAQGYGFAALRPILGIWKAMRNIAYMVFTVVFVFIGFAIMLRRKINPQTVVNIQAAIPKLVITLVLITFSYAIAGLMIDLMYLSIYFIILIATSFIFKGGNAMTVSWMQTLGLDSDMSAISVEKVALGWNITQNMLGFIVFGPVQNASSAVTDMITAAFGVDGILATIFKAIGIFDLMSLVAFVVISIAILVQMFRTLFALIGCYVQIILAIIFAPIQLAMNAMPGSNAFNKWIRNLFANLAVFPALVAMILITLALVGENTQNGIGYQGDDFGGRLNVNNWVRDSNTGFMPPQLPGADANAVQGVIAIGFIMLMPEVVKITKKALQVEDSGLGQLAQQRAMGPVASPFNYGKNMLMSGAQQTYGTAAAGYIGGKVGSTVNKIRGGSEVKHDRDTTKKTDEQSPDLGVWTTLNNQVAAKSPTTRTANQPTKSDEAGVGQ